jgi:hypothetical protein
MSYVETEPELVQTWYVCSGYELKSVTCFCFESDLHALIDRHAMSLKTPEYRYTRRHGMSVRTRDQLRSPYPDSIRNKNTHLTDMPCLSPLPGKVDS